MYIYIYVYMYICIEPIKEQKTMHLVTWSAWTSTDRWNPWTLIPCPWLVTSHCELWRTGSKMGPVSKKTMALSIVSRVWLPNRMDEQTWSSYLQRSLKHIFWVNKCHSSPYYRGSPGCAVKTRCEFLRATCKDNIIVRRAQQTLETIWHI